MRHQNTKQASWKLLNTTNARKMEENITKDQADVIVILENMRMKVLVTKCVLIAFFIIMAFMILLFTCIKTSWVEKTVVGVIEAILGGTMYPLVSHYLPSLANTKTGTERAKRTAVKKD